MIETHNIAKNLGWEVGQDYPEWGNNDLYLTTIRGGYLLDKETPNEAYHRLASTAAHILEDESLQKHFYEIL